MNYRERYVVIDWETRSKANLLAVGGARYAEDETTSIICLGYKFSDEDKPKIWKPGDPLPFDLFTAALGGTLVVAHNVLFEKWIWEEVAVKKHDFPSGKTFNWYDSMASCAARAIALSLDKACLFLNLDFQKDADGHAAMKRITTPQRGKWVEDQELYEKTYAYCADDVLAEENLFRRLGILMGREYEFWQLNQRMQERGIPIDLTLVNRLIDMRERAKEPLAAKFAALTGGLRATQREKVLGYIRDMGGEMPDLRAETVEKTLQDPSLPELQREILEMRQKLAGSATKKLETMRDCATHDGRVHGAVQFHGATTGRDAGRLIQPHNFPRGLSKMDVDAFIEAALANDDETAAAIAEAANGDIFSGIKTALRGCIAAPDGYDFISGDYSTIEARKLLAWAGQYDKIEVIKQGKDIYCDMASKIFGRPIDKVKDPDERQEGKGAVLGLGFGMGAKRFAEQSGHKHDLDYYKKVVDIYRSEFAPKVVKLWREVEKAAISAVWDGAVTQVAGSTFRLWGEFLLWTLPSKKTLYYYRPQKTMERVPWDHDQRRRGIKYLSPKKGTMVWVHTYGALLVENAVQSMAGTILAEAALRLDKTGVYKPIFSVHDETNSLVAKDEGSEAEYAGIMKASEPWVERIGTPIDVETWRGKRFRK